MTTLEQRSNEKVWHFWSPHQTNSPSGGNSIWLKYVQMKLGACDAMAVSPAADHLSGKMMSKQPPDKKTSSSNTLSLQMFPIWQLLIWPAAAQSLNFLSHLFSVYFWMNFCFGVESQKSPAPPTSRLVGPCVESLSAAFCVSNRKQTNGGENDFRCTVSVRCHRSVGHKYREVMLRRVFQRWCSLCFISHSHFFKPYLVKSSSSAFYSHSQKDTCSF